MPPGFFGFRAFGTLSFFVSQPAAFPVTVDPHFATPYSRSLTFGFQRQLANDLVISADFYHKGIENILGVRETNLPFEARIDSSGALLTPVNGFGPWYSGLYNAGIFSFQKRMSHHFLLGGSYTFAAENDNALCSQLAVSSESAQSCYSTDSFRGVVPVVTDPGGPRAAPVVPIQTPLSSHAAEVTFLKPACSTTVRTSTADRQTLRSATPSNFTVSWNCPGKFSSAAFSARKADSGIPTLP